MLQRSCIGAKFFPQERDDSTVFSLGEKTGTLMEESHAKKVILTVTLTVQRLLFLLFTMQLYTQ